MFQRGCMIIYIYTPVHKNMFEILLSRCTSSHYSMFNFTFVLKADACMYAYIIWMIFFALQRVPRIFADVKTGAAPSKLLYSY